MAILGALSLVGAVLTWVAVGSPGLKMIAGRFGSSLRQPRAVPVQPGTLDGGRLSLTEKVTVDLLGGVGASEKVSAHQLLLAQGASRDEKALLEILVKGSEAEALEALRALAALGGADNRRRFAAIMKDHTFPAALRTEAARALLETGSATEKLLAARALGMIGGEANTATLLEMIKNSELPETLRLEAALGLGQIGTPQAGDGILEAFWMFSDPDIHEQLLGALGHFNFQQIEPLWQEYLADPDTSSELRVAAVDALSNSSSDALPFLMKMAATDQDPEVREMSAWAISAHSQTGALGPELTRMLQVEQEADVRRRLYEALAMQDKNGADAFLPLIQAEADVAARIAGFNAVGAAIKKGADSAVFDAQVVPELMNVAVSKESLNLRMRAVFALRRADSAMAQQALQTIANSAEPKIAAAARHGLKANK